MGGAPTIVQIRPGVAFAPDAASSFRRAEASWREKTGRQFIDCNSSYRDWATQLDMYNDWNAYVNGTGPYPGHSRAIHPDISKHCQGVALDSDDWVIPGFIAHMAEHGWIRTAPNDPTERHHFEYQWWRDQHRDDPTPAGDGEAFEEDDMYNQAARDELMWELACLRPIKLYALVDETGAGGWIWVGPSGAWWAVPSGAYAQLADAQKLSQSRPIRAMQQDEFRFLTTQLLPITTPLSDAETELERIVSLDETTVQRIVDGIGELPVALTPAQLDAVADAAARGAEEGGAAGAKEAIRGLSFVVAAG